MEALTSDSYSDTSTASYASDHEQQKVLLSALPKKPIKIIKAASNSAYLLPPTSLRWMSRILHHRNLKK